MSKSQPLSMTPPIHSILQQMVFQSSHPSTYWPGSTLLNICDCMRTDISMWYGCRNCIQGLQTLIGMPKNKRVMLNNKYEDNRLNRAEIITVLHLRQNDEDKTTNMKILYRLIHETIWVLHPVISDGKRKAREHTV